MATTIVNNLVSLVPIQYQDQQGNPIPAPSGDTVTVQNDNAAGIDARVEEDGNHNRTLVLTPMQPDATANITVTDTQHGGPTLVTAAEAFTVAANSNHADSIHLLLDQITTRPMPGRGSARVTISR